MVANDVLAGKLEAGPSLSDSEKALRVMARENRFARRLLSKGFSDFLGYAAETRFDSRMMQSSSIGYVFAVCDADIADDRKYRNAILGLRCLVARNDMRDCETIIGIGTERPSEEKGFSLDIVYLHLPTLSPEDVKRGEAIREEHGYFRLPVRTRVQEDEYPVA